MKAYLLVSCDGNLEASVSLSYDFAPEEQQELYQRVHRQDKDMRVEKEGVEVKLGKRGHSYLVQA